MRSLIMPQRYPCPGEPEPGADEEASRPPEWLHCGHAKGQWYAPAQFIDPRVPDCEEAFTYTTVGQIRVSPAAPRPAAAHTTLERLNLDGRVLRRRRAGAIGVELDHLAEVLTTRGRLSRADVEARMDRLHRRDARGRYAPFAPALLDILTQRAKTLP